MRHLWPRFVAFFMKKSFLKINSKTILGLAFLAGLATVFSCANIVQPTGGPRDTEPPKLDTLHSTRNFQTRFKKQDIVLAFDEWVELKDVFTQVIISPPLAKRPEIVRRKKTIEVHFADDEVLRDSATYVINFGQAIRDITESNVNPVIFVFSTGDYIDSLSVEGQIVDAWTGKPADKTLFMLYENLADSVVRTERPFYFALTDKDGKFKVQNIKSGRFKAVALTDQNLNYRFDSDAEMVGFLDSNLVLGRVPTLDSSELKMDSLQVDSLLNDSLNLPPDSLRQTNRPNEPPTPSVSIRLFAADKALFLRSKETSKYGQVKLAFNRPPTEAKISFENVGQVVYYENEKDTLRFWYHLPERDTSWQLYVQRDTSVDTVLVKSGLRQAFFAAAKLTTNKLPGQTSKLTPGQSLRLTSNHPLTSFAATNILLLEDTAKIAVQPRLEIDSTDRRSLKVDYSWKEGVSYELMLLPGALTDIFGLSNTDTVRQKTSLAMRKDFGTMTLKVTGMDSAKAYVIHLLDKPDGGQVVKKWTVADAADFQVKIELLPPATYTVELIEDLDRNGQWTTGSYDLHRQPERVLRKALEELRANWELEAEVEVGF